MIVGGILLSIVPVSYLALKLGGDPVSVYVVYLFICIIAIIARLLVVRPLIHLSLRLYFSKVVLHCATVLVVAFIISWAIKRVMPEGVVYSILICSISIVVVLLLSYFVGMTKPERSFVNDRLKGFVSKYLKK